MKNRVKVIKNSVGQKLKINENSHVKYRMLNHTFPLIFLTFDSQIVDSGF